MYFHGYVWHVVEEITWSNETVMEQDLFIHAFIAVTLYT
jgi:hypothetical protein